MIIDEAKHKTISQQIAKRIQIYDQMHGGKLGASVSHHLIINNDDNEDLNGAQIA